MEQIIHSALRRQAHFLGNKKTDKSLCPRASTAFAARGNPQHELSYADNQTYQLPAKIIDLAHN